MLQIFGKRPSARPAGYAKEEPPYSENALLAVETARSYWLARREGRREFLYSGGRTFLNQDRLGYVNDEQGRALIDCSTYIHLVLRGIPYESSPYARVRGELGTFFAGKLAADRSAVWADKGLAWHKWSRKREPGRGLVRYAADIAEYYWEQGRCFTDMSWLKPGDLTFHRAHTNGRFRSVTHVGIVTDDEPLSILNATSRGEGAVILTRLSSRDDVIFCARPDYGTK